MDVCTTYLMKIILISQEIFVEMLGVLKDFIVNRPWDSMYRALDMAVL